LIYANVSWSRGWFKKKFVKISLDLFLWLAPCYFPKRCCSTSLSICLRTLSLFRSHSCFVNLWITFYLSSRFMPNLHWFINCLWNDYFRIFEIKQLDFINFLMGRTIVCGKVSKFIRICKGDQLLGSWVLSSVHIRAQDGLYQSILPINALARAITKLDGLWMLLNMVNSVQISALPICRLARAFRTDSWSRQIDRI